MIMTLLQVGDRVRPKGVRPVERGRSWLGTITHVQEEYPRGSDIPYRILTVASDLGEVWTDDQRAWLPAFGRSGRYRASGPSYMYVGGLRIGWYDVGVWLGIAFLALAIIFTFPCGLILGGIPLGFVIHGWSKDRRTENLRVAAQNQSHGRGQDGP